MPLCSNVAAWSIIVDFETKSLWDGAPTNSLTEMVAQRIGSIEGRLWEGTRVEFVKSVLGDVLVPKQR